MNRELSNANRITPNTITRWTVLVQVIERRNPRKAENGTQYRNYMVTDMTGTRVPIVLFGSSVAFFMNTLMPFKRYYISSAIVSDTNPAYRIVEYPYTWSLRPRHLVEPHDESVPPPLPCTFPYEQFSTLYRYADQTRQICIKALVIHAFPAQDIDKSSTVRDFVVINEEKIPMMFRVWDDLMIDTDVNVHARYKVPALIVAYGLKVTTHNGLSLGTRTNAYILHNPPLNEERPLKDWYAANSTRVTELLNARAYRDTTLLFRPPTAAEIIPLDTAVQSIENVKTLWTKGKLTYIPGQEKLWFEACEKCFRPVDAGADWNFWCSNCHERSNVIIRGNVNVFLSYEDTVVEASLKSPDTDKLIPYTANELKVAAEKNTPLTKEVEAALEKTDVLCFLKYYDRTTRGSTVRRYPILKVYTDIEAEAYHQAQEQTQQHVPLEPPPATPPTDAQVVHLIGSSSSVQTENCEPEFFTPTTKKTLEDISQLHHSEKTLAGSASNTKRMLMFDDEETNTEPSISTLQPIENATAANETVLPPDGLPQNTVTLSPSKKLKGKKNAA